MIPLRALMVEDSEDDTLLIQESLKNGGYDVHALCVDSEEALRRALRDEPWDIVLSDYCLPSFDGPGTLAVLKETGLDIPVIVISGTVGEDIAVETLKLGADDYLLKQNLTRLVPAVERALDMAQSRRRRHSLEHMKTVILGYSPDLICTFDKQGRFLEVSAASKRMLGYEPSELKGMYFGKLAHPDDLSRIEAEFQAVLQGRPSQNFEKRCLHQSGRTVHLLWSAALSPADGVVVGVGHDITERKQKAEALQRVEEDVRRERALLRALIDSMPDLIYFKDKNFVYLGCNRACENYLGLPEHQLIGKTDFDVMPEEFALQYRQWDEELYASGRSLHFEEEVRRADGSIGLFDTIKTPFLGPNGELLGLLGVSRDITERKQKDDALRRERDYADAVLNSLPGVFYDYDDTPRLLRWNKNHETITGYSAEELAGIHPLSFFSEEEKQRIADGIAAAIEKGESQTEANFLLKDGSNIPYLFTGASFEHDGRRHVVGLGTDISERKRMEEALREQTALFASQVESSLDGILVVDRHGNKVIQNRRFGELWKIPPEIGASPDDAPQLAFAISRTKDPSGASALVAWLHEHPEAVIHDEVELTDGSILDRYSAPVLDREGQYYGRIWSFRDITENRQHQQKLAEALAHEKELSEQARAGERAKSEFLAVMSHEIRTPLNGILGFAELLRQSPRLTPEDRGHAAVITQSGEALLRILDDILDFSRLEAGRMAIEKAAFCPRAMLEDIRTLLSRQADETGVRLLVSCDESVPGRLEGDAGRLRQVLLNLAGNALKFTEKGSVRIELAPLPQRPGAYLFSVIDTGCGITREELARIFRPFTQADSSTSRRHNGTGLGLTICRRLTELLGGTISVESAPGRGSAFRVVLPLAEAQTSSPRAPSGPSGMPLDAAFAGRHPLRVLIVEDDAVNLKLLQVLVSRLGYPPLSGRNGREAIEIFREASPDILLMDMQMPEMDGVEATEKIRALEQAAGVERPAFIVALTANIFPADRQRCLDAGMNGYLNKPVRIRSLAEVLIQASSARAAE